MKDVAKHIRTRKLKMLIAALMILATAPALPAVTSSGAPLQAFAVTSPHGVTPHDAMSTATDSPTGMPTATATPTETPTATPLPTGAVRFKSRTLGDYLYEDPVNQVVLHGARDVTDPYSQWILEPFNGQLRIRNVATGDYMNMQAFAAGTTTSHELQCTPVDNSWGSPVFYIATSTDDPNYIIIHQQWWPVVDVSNPSYASFDAPDALSAAGQLASADFTIEPDTAGTATATTAPTGTPTSTATATPLPTTVVYQAENAFVTSGAHIATSGSGFSGSGYVTGYTAVGANTIFAVNIPADGSYNVTLHYANGSSVTNTLDIYANGILLTPTSLAPTGGWSTWSDQTESLSLRAGLNTLAYRYDAGNSGNVNLDYIAVANSQPLASRGATVPYVEQEAEQAATNGTLIGPDSTFTHLASEASGRRAVTLSGPGQYVEFTLTRPANGMELRYSIPDSADGTGLTAPLSLYLNGVKAQDITLTSRYSWFYGSYPFTNNPSDGNPHHFYDEVHVRFASTLAAGAKVRLQVDAGDTAPSYTIDLADFEQVPAAYTEPASYLSVTDYGADPAGASDSTTAIQNAVNAAEAQGKGVWVPAGTYTVTGHIMLSNVVIRGAGPWYTVLHGAGVGLYGQSGTIQVFDLAIQGEVIDRVDSAQVNGIGGAYGNGSIIQNVWIEHTKVGMWFDGPFHDLLVVGDRIRDTTADGINLHWGISHSMVEQTEVRNTGDDGLAMWADGVADHDNVFRFNTVQLPILASNISVYGGYNNSVTDNTLYDTVTQGAGIQIANRFKAVPLSGTTSVARNLLVRTGSFDPGWTLGEGSIWIFPQDENITGTINISDEEIDQATYQGILLGVQASINNAITNLTFNNVAINSPGTYGIEVMAQGSAAFSNVTVANPGIGGIHVVPGAESFSITEGPGNVGWNAPPTPTATATATGTPPTSTPTNTAVPNTPVRIKNRALGTYLYESHNQVAYESATQASSDPTSQWWLESFHGNIRIRNAATGDYMNLQDLTGYVECFQPIYDVWASPQWKIQPAPDAGYSVIRNIWQANDVIEASTGIYTATYGMLPTDPVAVQNAEWTFESVMLPVPTATATPTAVPTTAVRFKNRLLGTYLYEANNTVMYGTPYASDPTSQWMIESYNGNVRLQNVATGHFLSLQDLTGYVESIPVSDTWPSAQWLIGPAPDAGYVVISSTWQTSLVQGVPVPDVIDVANQLGYAEYSPLPPYPSSAEWTIEPAPALPTSTATTTPTDTPTNTPTPTPTCFVPLAVSAPPVARNNHTITVLVKTAPRAWVSGTLMVDRHLVDLFGGIADGHGALQAQIQVSLPMGTLRYVGGTLTVSARDGCGSATRRRSIIIVASRALALPNTVASAARNRAPA